MADEQVPPGGGLYQGSPLQKTVDAIGSGLSTAGDYLFGEKGRIGGQLVPQSMVDEKAALMQRAGVAPQRAPATEQPLIPPVAKLSPEQLQQEMMAQQQTQQAMQPAQMPQSPQVGSQLQPLVEQQKIEKAIGDAESAKFAAEQKYYENREEAAKQEAIKQKEINNAFSYKYSEILGSLDQIRTNMAKDDIMNAQVDQNRLWNNLGTPQKILGGIAVFLGGMGAGLTGGSNEALKIITNAIDRDVEAQKRDIDNRRANYKQNLEGQENALSHLRNLYKDNEVAENALRALQLDAMENKFKQVVSQNNSEIVKKKAEMAIQEIQLKKNDLKMKIQEAVQWQTAMSGGMSDKPFTAEQMMSVRDPEKLKLMENHNALLVPGYGRALNEKSANDAREIVSSSNILIHILDKMMAIKTSNPAESVVPGTQAYKDLTSLHGELMGAVKKTEKLGTLDNGVVMLVNKIAPDPTGWNPNLVGTYKNLKPLQIKKTQFMLEPLLGVEAARKFKGPQPTTSAPIKKY